MNILRKLNINIKNKEKLLEALTHSSYSNEHKDTINYERLEFLGDSVLSLVVSEYFYTETTLNEGEMSKKRASFVCEQALAFYGHKIHLEDYIRVGEGQKSDINDSIIADVFEALIAVIYLETGFNKARKFINHTVIKYIKEDKAFFSDYKSLLQEIMQAKKEEIEYIIIKEAGKNHDKTFTIDVKIGNITYGRGIGKSKKEAEQLAAKDAFSKYVK